MPLASILSILLELSGAGAEEQASAAPGAAEDPAAEAGEEGGAEASAAAAADATNGKKEGEAAAAPGAAEGTSGAAAAAGAPTGGVPLPPGLGLEGGEGAAVVAAPPPPGATGGGEDGALDVILQNIRTKKHNGVASSSSSSPPATPEKPDAGGVEYAVQGSGTKRQLVKFKVDAEGRKRRLCDVEGCQSNARQAGRCPRHLTPALAAAAKAQRKAREKASKARRTEEEEGEEEAERSPKKAKKKGPTKIPTMTIPEDPDADKRAPSGPLCVLPGCAGRRQNKGTVCCAKHKKLASRLEEVLATAATKSAPGGSGGGKSLKPQLKAGTKVYAAYWEPDDAKRREEPSWHPGAVSSVAVRKASDERFGPVRWYNVNYDDGDRTTGIHDAFVFPVEDYELVTRRDEENEKRKRAANWKGVKNVTDGKSKDAWAASVGWYVAAIDGERRPFSTLAEALRAYDAHVVRAKGLSTRKVDLNLAEEWGDLFQAAAGGAKATGGKRTRDSAGSAKGAKRRKLDKDEEEEEEEDPEEAAARAARNAPCRALDGCTKKNFPNCDGYCLEHFKLLEPDKEKVEAVVAEMKKKVACKAEGCVRQKNKKFDNYCRICFRDKEPAAYEAILAQEKKDKAEKKARKEALKAAERAREEAQKAGVEHPPAAEAANGDAKAEAGDGTGVASALYGDGAKPSGPDDAKADVVVVPVDGALVNPKTPAKKKAPVKRKLTPAQMCKLEGCETRKKLGCGGYCAGHKWLALKLSAPIAATEDTLRLKPVYEVDEKVYAAYWPPEDMDRETKPTWHPGVVTYVKERDEPDDEKYGEVRRYNVTYDLGDRLRGLNEHLVCSSEDYEQRLNLDVLEEGGGRKMAAASWRGVKGVRNVADKKSDDKWAKHCGWYVATIDGTKHNFASLQEALRTYDAATVRRKGLLTQEKDLNMPEEWGKLFGKEDVADEAGNGMKKVPKNDSIFCGAEGCTLHKVTNCYGYCLHHFKLIETDQSKVEAVTALVMKQRRCKTTGCLRYKVLKGDGYCGPCFLEKNPGPNTFPTTQGEFVPGQTAPAKWTSEEIQLLIKLDEQYASYSGPDKYKKMAQMMPHWGVSGCSQKILNLRYMVREGMDIIGSVLGLVDIKTTLANWKKEEIGLLMSLEDKFQGLEEEAKNAKISQALPRWNTDKCSFKTLFMRWQTMVRQETETKKRKRKETMAKKDAKREAEAQAKKDAKREAEAQAKRNKAKKAAAKSPQPPSYQAATKAKAHPVLLPGGKTAVASPPNSAKKVNAETTPPHGKIDDKFVDILNNDPYLQDRCQPKTVEELTGGPGHKRENSC
ncbi:LOW QUALITY PROTEIN: hypothetical protein ACHAWF_012782 [Thalassiosira exigua]